MEELKQKLFKFFLYQCSIIRVTAHLHNYIFLFMFIGYYSMRLTPLKLVLIGNGQIYFFGSCGFSYLKSQQK
jgi:hypothetical protein